ncbi:MAG: hypothetical protein ACLFUJ_02210 [Phycisphaerae bacterium]
MATDEGQPVILTSTRGPIRVVYQISEDQWQDGVGKALAYMDKLLDQYRAEGVDTSRVTIRGVYHGPASEHLLTDAAWNRIKNTDTGNPNTKLLEALARRGVHVELCNSRRLSNGWSVEDIHPSVDLVSGAFLRGIDLQHHGYAYIKF